MTARTLIASTVAAGLLGLSGTAPKLHAQATQPARELVLQIHSVKCIDETTRTNLGSDEIDIAAITIDANQHASRVPTLDLGRFDAREVRTLNPPKVLARFKLGRGPAFPRKYAVMLILAERDAGGGLGARLDKLVALANEAPAPKTAEGKNAVAEAAKLAAAGALTAELGPVAGVAFAKAVELVGGWSKDDVFTPYVAKISMRADTFRFPGGGLVGSKETITRKNHRGTYQIMYSWRLVR